MPKFSQLILRNCNNFLVMFHIWQPIILFLCGGNYLGKCSMVFVRTESWEGWQFCIFICSFSLFSARRTTKCHSCTYITTPACVCSGGWCVNGYPVSIWGGEGGGSSWVYIGRTFYLFVFECEMPSFVEIQMTSISFHREVQEKMLAEWAK